LENERLQRIAAPTGQSRSGSFLDRFLGDML
jgi:hypothetical protein